MKSLLSSGGCSRYVLSLWFYLTFLLLVLQGVELLHSILI